jgi:hypothetical protein
MSFRPQVAKTGSHSRSGKKGGYAAGRSEGGLSAVQPRLRLLRVNAAPHLWQRVPASKVNGSSWLPIREGLCPKIAQRVTRIRAPAI